MSVETEDEFRKELVEVFVQEAQEWLRQIHLAMDELEQTPPPDRHLILVNTVKAGLANMGGSAATVGLDEIERASFSALSLLEAIKDPGARSWADDFVVFRKQLEYINAALARTAGVVLEDVPHHPGAERQPMTVQTTDLLATLRALRDQQGKAGPSHRNFIQTLINQLEGIQHQGIKQCDVSSLREFLDRLASGEEGFLQVVEQQLAGLTEQLARLKNETGRTQSFTESLQTTIEQTGHLWSAAQQVNATHATTFFMGLHSFLTVVMQGKAAVAARKYEAVEARLCESVNAIRRWVEAGRAERKTIERALPNCTNSTG